MYATAESVLSDELLQHCAERADMYDRKQRFFPGCRYGCIERGLFAHGLFIYACVLD